MSATAPLSSSSTVTVDLSRKEVWIGRVLSGVAVLFLPFDAIGKLLRPEVVVRGTQALGLWLRDRRLRALLPIVE